MIEDALLHHLNALDALPADIIVPPRMVVSRESGEQMLKRIASPAKPTKALQSPMKD